MSMEIETTISDIKLFLEKLKADLPEVFSSSKDGEKTAVSGKVLYLGGLLEAIVSVDEALPQNTAFLQEDSLLITLKNNKESPSETAELWLRQRATEILPQRTKAWAEKLGVEYNNIVIKDQKTMWASCSSKRNINYSYRIVKMPSGTIDYLIVHELTHLIHFNHSSDYWVTVEQTIPDYKIHRKWLNDNRYAIMSDIDLSYTEPPASAPLKEEALPAAKQQEAEPSVNQQA